MPELQVEELKGVEIFEAGIRTDSRGNTTEWSIADLDEMVENRTRLPGVKAMLKLMHLNPKEHMRITAAPALGWITDIRREGTKLVADFSHVPRKVALLVRAKSYRRISAEIFRRFRDEASGRTFKNVVSAAGLLGAVLPAVTTLEDVFNLYEIPPPDAGDIETYGLEGASDGFEWGDCYDGAMSFALATHEREPITDGGDNEMEQKDLDAMEARLEAKFAQKAKEDKAETDTKAAEFKASINDALGVDAGADTAKAIKALKSDNDAKDDAITEAATKNFEAAVDGVFVAAIKDGKMLPAEKAMYQTIANTLRADVDDNGKATFSIAEKDVTGEPVELLKQMLEARGKVIEFSKESGKEGGTKDVVNNIPKDLRNPNVMGVGQTPAAFTGMDQDTAVWDYAKKHNVDYVAAFEAVHEIEVDQYTPEGAAASFSNSADGETITRNG